MRVARDFAVGGARGIDQFHAPERPRVADPDLRRRIAGYLDGGTPTGSGLHTDGVWLWPERFVAEVLDDGLAPEPEFLRDMARHNFRAPAPAPGADLRDAAWRAGPPPAPRLLITYFVRVDETSDEQSPLSLLRRVVDPAGLVAEEALWRDLRWHPTQALGGGKADYDIREVTAAHAAGVLDTWCAKWHREALNRTRANP